MNFHQTMRSGSNSGAGRSFLNGFAGQHTNPIRAARRKAIKEAGGIRQFKRKTHASVTLI
jgi:hypothetical protein